MLARRASRSFAAACVWRRVARARGASSAPDVAVGAIWTGEEDRSRSVWTRYGSPESSAFAHRGILGEVGTTVRARETRMRRRCVRVERERGGGEGREDEGGGTAGADAGLTWWM